MSRVNRKTIRAAIAAGLAANMPSAAAVYGYQRSKLDGKAAVVRIFDASSERPPLSQSGETQSVFGYIIQLWVLTASATGQSFTEAEAEDKLADMELELITWIEANQYPVGQPWRGLEYDRPSFVDTYKAGNELYLVEDIFVSALANE
ncbi:MAG: hypothetical protein KDE31_19655 [Caldilineaceae bacterium]|nr:hypothetical protein [Caldilineaceae bacterium]